MLRQKCLVCLFLTRGGELVGGVMYQSRIELFKAKCLHTYYVPGTKCLYSLLIPQVNWVKNERCISLVLGISTKVEIRVGLVV